VTAATQRDGILGEGHVKVIRSFFAQLPQGVDLFTRQDAEADLARKAGQYRPDEPAKYGKGLMDCLNPDGTFSDEDRAHGAGSSSVSRNSTACHASPAASIPNCGPRSTRCWPSWPRRATKDNYGRYLISADPTSDEANSLWGVEVLPTTQITAGDGLLLDTRKFGFVVVREAVSLRTGTNDDDFTRNLQRWVAEERLELAVERPAAVLSISGLPTS
jgi:hypothetical protein